MFSKTYCYSRSEGLFCNFFYGNSSIAMSQIVSTSQIKWRGSDTRPRLPRRPSWLSTCRRRRRHPRRRGPGCDRRSSTFRSWTSTTRRSPDPGKLRNHRLGDSVRRFCYQSCHCVLCRESLVYASDKGTLSQDNGEIQEVHTQI